MKYFSKVLFLSLLVSGLILFFSQKTALAQLPDLSEFNLVLHLQASNGFDDLSNYH